MSSNIQVFERQVARHHQEVIPSLARDQVDAIMLGMLASVMRDTPVVKGRMKGNWQVTFGDPPGPGGIERTDESAKGTLGQTFVEESKKLQLPRDPFRPGWIHNGLQYAVYVNDGTETQRAQRIIERTAARFGRRARSG